MFFSPTAKMESLWISRARDALEEFVDLDVSYPNGIALSVNENILYVAHVNGGISMIDVRPRRRASCHGRPTPRWPASMGSIRTKTVLIAIQNGIGNPRVNRLYLNSTGDRVERVETIEYRNPAFDIPTTGGLRLSATHFITSQRASSKSWTTTEISKPARN